MLHRIKPKIRVIKRKNGQLNNLFKKKKIEIQKKNKNFQFYIKSCLKRQFHYFVLNLISFAILNQFVHNDFYFSIYKQFYITS